MNKALSILCIAIMASCTVYDLPDPKPPCSEVLIEQREGKYVIWWLPDQEPAHQGKLVSVNGHMIKEWCRRDEALKITSTGKWSAIYDAGGILCIDYDSSISVDDQECCTPF